MAFKCKIESSKYKGVKIRIHKNGNKVYMISLYGSGSATYKTEREAALVVDKIYIKNGKEPVNILKRI
jgi:hypothetical protein